MIRGRGRAASSEGRARVARLGRAGGADGWEAPRSACISHKPTLAPGASPPGGDPLTGRWGHPPVPVCPSQTTRPRPRWREVLAALTLSSAGQTPGEHHRTQIPLTTRRAIMSSPKFVQTVAPVQEIDTDTSGGAGGESTALAYGYNKADAGDGGLAVGGDGGDASGGDGTGVGVGGSGGDSDVNS